MAQTGKYIEPIIAQMASLLDSGMAAKLDAIDTEMNDTITLADVEAIYQGQVFVTTDQVAIVIYPISSEGGDSTSQPESFYTTYQVAVYIIITCADQVDMWKRLWRYQRAILEVLKADDSLSSQVDICEFAGFVYDNPWRARTENSYTDAVGVLFNIQHEETIA